jgi:hypothetical protein
MILSMLGRGSVFSEKAQFICDLVKVTCMFQHPFEFASCRVETEFRYQYELFRIGVYLHFC